MPNSIKLPCHQRYAAELKQLTNTDTGRKPPGWRLSPQAVRRFIVGDEPHNISRKFYGDDPLVDRAIVSLMSNRGLLLAGEPGTAKSMLSELLATAISGDAELTIQGTAGCTEDQLKYAWNYALLLAEGPTEKALVPAPVYTAMQTGRLVRLEEITRCPAEVQDCLISLLSDKVVHVPELGAEFSIRAKPGFNIIATANLRDRGVNEMSSALKRRFNFETVEPIADKAFEIELVQQQAQELLAEHEAEATLDTDLIDLLVTTFQDLRTGQTAEGASVETPSTVMSTAEAVAVTFSAALDACYFDDGQLQSQHLLRQLRGTVLKDEPEDIKKVQRYFDVVIKHRAKQNGHWQAFYQARRQGGF